LPLLVTPKEIEEFVQKTYDLFEIIKEEQSPIPNFNSLYKNVGIAKKVEKLSGELIDYIYILTKIYMCLLLTIGYYKMKKNINIICEILDYTIFYKRPTFRRTNRTCGYTV